MATFNQVTFIGRLGKDPELNVTSEGTPYTRFSLAVDQGKDTPAMWLNVVCWKELADDKSPTFFSSLLCVQCTLHSSLPITSARLLHWVYFSRILTHGYPDFCTSRRFSVNSRFLSQVLAHRRPRKEAITAKGVLNS